MDIGSIPEAFQSKIRLMIISAIITGEKSFNQIKEVTNASDGNLSIHLTRLEDAGYLVSSKKFVARKPCTTYTLTENGRREFEEYVKMLDKLLKQSDWK